MVSWIPKGRCSPIGVDIGSRSIKLLQFDAERTAVGEAARWDLPPRESSESPQQDESIVEAVGRAREGRKFRGRRAILCLSSADLFVQNIRVPQAKGEELEKIIRSEAAGRLPFDAEEAEIRFIEAADVRQGDMMRREVIVLACRKAAVERLLSLAEQANLMPVAIDVEPSAMLRCYSKLFRRDNDQQRRTMFVNLGASNSMVVISKGPNVMFVKYLDIGGRHLDEAVASHLKMRPADAASLRRHNGDRRSDQRDPEITRSIDESVRPVFNRLANELSLCLRYYSVTFRGRPVELVVLGGGEATESLAEWVSRRLDLPCEEGNPLRPYANGDPAGRNSQWDVAAGLALRENS